MTILSEDLRCKLYVTYLFLFYHQKGRNLAYEIVLWVQLDASFQCTLTGKVMLFSSQVFRHTTWCFLKSNLAFHSGFLSKLWCLHSLRLAVSVRNWLLILIWPEETPKYLGEKNSLVLLSLHLGAIWDRSCFHL